MRDLSKTVLTSFLLLLTSTVTQAQVAKKPAAAVDSSVVAERGAKLAETRHCAEAMPLLKKSFPQTSDKDLKLKIGFDAVRCAMTLNQADLAVDFLRLLNREFPHAPEVLYLTVHIYSDLSLRASQELVDVAPSSSEAHQLNAESLEVQGKWDETAVKLLPANPASHYQLAIAYGRTGRKEDAKREAALQRETADRIEAEKKKAAALQGQLPTPLGEKPEPPR